MCIGCAACIDACDQVMDKMGYEKGLIRYSTQNAIDGKYADEEISKHVFRPRTLFYTVVLTGIVIAFFYTLANRIPMRVDVIRDRLTLSRETPSGGLENLYRLQVINMDGKPHHYTISAKGLDGLKITSGDQVDVAALGTENLNVTLEAPKASVAHPTQPVFFEIKAADDSRLVREAKSSFLK
jgi:polyferredoxin